MGYEYAYLVTHTCDYCGTVVQSTVQNEEEIKDRPPTWKHRTQGNIACPECDRALAEAEMEVIAKRKAAVAFKSKQTPK